MMELMRESLVGFRTWNENGKFVALFLAALLFLWLGSDLKKKKEVQVLHLFALVGACLCILPPSAALLMFYQTRFYEYRWVWSVVPMTILTALGGVEVFRLLIAGRGGRDTAKGKAAGGILGMLLFLVIVLSGGLGQTPEGVENTLEKSARVQSVLEELKEVRDRYQGAVGEPAAICLWAPQEILSYARVVDGQILLLYGRNMWDRYLDAYTYDTYDETKEELYLWMEEMALHDTSAIALKSESTVSGRERNDFSPRDTERMVQLAHGQGANVILLPATLEEEALALTDTLDCVVERAGDYYLVMF